MNANRVPLSPLTFLARSRRAYPGKTAVVDRDGTEVSYQELAADADAMAGALRARHPRGDRVAALDLNGRGSWRPTSASREPGRPSSR